MGKAGGLIRLIRPVNSVMMGFAVLVGASLTGQAELSMDVMVKLILGFITGFTLTGASMAINDYYDREIDAINEPNRPIPSGAVAAKEALTFAAFLSLIGFIAAALTSTSCLVVSVFAWIVFVAYTTKGKHTGLPGNFLVSLCVAIPLIYGSLAVTKTLEPTIAIFAAMAFLSNTGREITKGIVDVQGDKTRNIKTVAVLHGEKAAAVSASIFYMLAVGISSLPWILKLVSIWFLPLVILTDAGLTASSFLLLRNPSRENARNVKNQILIWFLSGLAAFIAGSIK